MRVGGYFGGPELLSTLGVPLLKGRALTAADATTRPTPAIVTASLARTLWNVEEALGQVVSLGGRYGRYTVVGIAQDFAFGSMNEPIAGVVLWVHPGGYGIAPRFIVRTDRPELQVEAIRRMVKEVAPDAPRVTILTGHELVARDLGRQRLGAWFFSGFGLIALVLGAGGVFWLVAYLAESRRREFGIRLALGATSGHLVRRGVVAGVVPVAIRGSCRSRRGGARRTRVRRAAARPQRAGPSDLHKRGPADDWMRHTVGSGGCVAPASHCASRRAASGLAPSGGSRRRVNTTLKARAKVLLLLCHCRNWLRVSSRFS